MDLIADSDEMLDEVHKLLNHFERISSTHLPTGKRLSLARLKAGCKTHPHIDKARVHTRHPAAVNRSIKFSTSTPRLCLRAQRKIRFPDTVQPRYSTSARIESWTS